MNKMWRLKNCLLSVAQLLAFAPLISGCLGKGCSELDVSQLALENHHYENLTAKFKEGKLPPMAVAYASLAEKSAAEGTVLVSGVAEIERHLKATEVYPVENKLDQSVTSSIRREVSNYQTKFAHEIKGLLTDAATKRMVAKDLADRLFQHGKAGGEVHDLMVKLRATILASDVAGLNVLLEQLKKSVELFYARSSVLPMRLLQASNHQELTEMEGSMTELSNCYRHSAGTLTEAQFKLAGVMPSTVNSRITIS